MQPLPGFPKTMVHPAHQKGAAVPVHGTDPNTGRAYTDYHGTPDRYPPVEVYDPDQEGRHRAMGYMVYGEAAAPAAAYQEYPKMLEHPDYEPAVATIVATRNGANQIISPEIPGSNAKFPPVVVHSKEQEETEMARGYCSPGKPDADAVQASISAPYDPKRVTQEWPKVVNGVVVQNPGVDPTGFKEYPKWIGDKLVNSRAEEEAITGVRKVDVNAARKAALKKKADLEAELKALDETLSDGGSAVIDTSAGVASVELPASPPPTERKEIYAELDRRGITYSKNTPTQKLLNLLSQQAA